MKISDVKIGMEINHHSKGKGLVIDKTKRTIKVKFEFCTTKVTYKTNDAEFHPNDL